MAEKQPIYEFGTLSDLGISAVPVGSLVNVKNIGRIFTLTDKAGLSSVSSVQDALNLAANEYYKTDVTGPTGPPGSSGSQGIPGVKGDPGGTGPEGPPGSQGDPGAGVQIYGSDTIVNIRQKANVDGHMWIATDSGVDDDGNAVSSGDGIVSVGPSWLTVGPIRGPIGLTGLTGANGINGNTGPDGPEGPTGPTGPPGSDGSTGGVGSIGPVGPEGPTGPEGPQGPGGGIGVQGPEGEKGDKGDKGDDGNDGTSGGVGPKGDKGDKGDAGQDATVEFASQVETDAGVIDNKAISPKTLGAAGTMPIETGKKGQTVTNDGVRKGSFWTPFVSSPNVISEDYTIPAGTNASIVSPTINDGITITIPDGCSLVIL